MNTGLGLKNVNAYKYFLRNFLIVQQQKILLLVGLLADLIGIIVLKYLTGKNDYISISIKFGIRFLLYSLVFLTNNLVVCFVAITWSILIQTAYEKI